MIPNVTLTEAGEAALAEAKAALAAIDRLRAACAGNADLAGTRLRIGAVQSATIRLLPGWLKPFRARYPKVAVTLHEGTDPEVCGWVLAGAVDVGLTSAPHPDLVARTVAEDEYVVVLPAGHPLSSRNEISLDLLDGEKMILSGGGCETMIQDLLEAAGSQPEIAFMVRDNGTLAAMVREGLGLTIMPELALPDDMSALTVRRLSPALPRQIAAVAKTPADLGPAAHAFLSLLPGARNG